MQKPTARPAARQLPGQTAKPPAFLQGASSSTTPVPATSTVRKGPAPPSRTPAPPPPPPPTEPDIPLYRAKFAFAGQEGEMSLQKDDTVEVIEKDNNGWWLVKKDGVEGWAPSNYLELVPPKPKAAPAPPPPPAARRPPPAPANTTNSGPIHVPTKIQAKPVVANASASPVAVFPGIASGNGSATPWKKTPTPSSGASTDSSPAGSRPSSSQVTKQPPPVAAKPKPVPPPVGAKPGAPKIPGKPPVPTAPRPIANTASRPAAASKPAPTAVGQLDLSAAVSKSEFNQRIYLNLFSAR